MADQYDRDLDRDNQARGHEAGGPDQTEPPRDETEELERKLRRQGRPENEGDVLENRNLSGSTTWETLPSQADPHLQHGRKGHAESPNDLTHEELPKQQHRGGREQG